MVMIPRMVVYRSQSRLPYLQGPDYLTLRVQITLPSGSRLPYLQGPDYLTFRVQITLPSEFGSPYLPLRHQVLLMVYTLVPLSLHVAVLLCCSYSLLCELLNALLTTDAAPSLVVVRILLHLATHIIAAHIMLMTQVGWVGLS